MLLRQSPRFVMVLLRAALLAAALWSLAVAYASIGLLRSTRPEQSIPLCAFLGSDPHCWSTAARQAEELGAPDISLWMRALAANPRAVSPALGAASLLESSGQNRAAEILLRDAARLNQLFVPRWALASFYFRQGRTPEFESAGRAALARSTGDPAALFRLFELAAAPRRPDWNSIIPASGPVAAFWVEYLLQGKHWRELPPAFDRLVQPSSAPPSGPLPLSLFRAAEAALAAGHPEIARLAWNRLAQARWIPREPLREGHYLANSAFHPPLEPPVFDWRFYRIPGLSIRTGAPPGAVKFVLTGQQAERIPIFEQTLLLPVSRRFRLACEFRERGFNSGSRALYWTLEAAFGEELQRGPAASSSEDWSPWVFDFTTPPRAIPVRVVLKAVRPLGEARPSGEGWIRGITLQPLAAVERASS